MATSTPADAPETTTPTTLASPPFDSPNAELVIRTPDGVDFRVSKETLARASPFFADMFSLPRPVVFESNAALNIVDVAESSATWYHILSICYNVAPRAPIGHDEVWQLFEVAKKYDMSGVRWTLGQILVGIPHTTPQNRLRAYTLACAFGFPDVAIAAARSSLDHESRETYIPDLRCATSAAHFRWTEYRQKCADAATSFAMNTRLFRDSRWWGKISAWGLVKAAIHPQPRCPVSRTFTEVYDYSQGPVRSMLSDYMQQSEQALR